MAKDKTDINELLKVGAYSLDYDDEEVDKKKWWWKRASKNIPEVIKDDEIKAEEAFRQDKDWIFGTIEKEGSPQVDAQFGKVAEGVVAGTGSVAKAASGKVTGKAVGAITRQLSKVAFAFKEKRKRKRNMLLVGGIVSGAAIGAVIGTLLLPVIGTAIGGAIGATISAAAVGAAVVLGTLGAWAGLSATRAATKKVLGESKSNYKLTSVDLKKVKQNSHLDDAEIERLHAYARNREKQMSGVKAKASSVRKVRQRAFKKGSKQGLEHLIYFLVDDYKALNNTQNPNARQVEDQGFLFNMLKKLSQEDGLDVQARNCIRTELLGERPHIDIDKNTKTAFNKIRNQNSISGVLSHVLLLKVDKLANDQTGEKNVAKDDVADQLNRINEALTKDNAWDIISQILVEEKGLSQLHEGYHMQPKIYEIVRNELNTQKMKAKEIKEKGARRLLKAEEFRDQDPKKAKRYEKSGTRYIQNYKNIKEQAQRAEKAFNDIVQDKQPLERKIDADSSPSLRLGSHRKQP